MFDEYGEWVDLDTLWDNPYEAEGIQESRLGMGYRLDDHKVAKGCRIPKGERVGYWRIVE